MRYAFGLVALLVVAGIIVLFWSKAEYPVAKTGQDAMVQARSFAGQTASGISAKDSVKVEGETINGELRSLRVTSVTPNGYFEQYYGLKVGDKVLEIYGTGVGTFNDADTAQAFLWSIQSRPITILRDNQKQILNASDGTLKASAVSLPGAK